MGIKALFAGWFGRFHLLFCPFFRWLIRSVGVFLSTRNLIADDFGGDFLDLALSQFFELEWPVGDADQPVHFKTDCAKCPPYLTIFAFAQSNRRW